MKDQTVVSVKNVTKKFGSFHALRSFNLTVKKGEVHGFLGPNGAGKSTTIRIILGLLRKSDGDVTLFGQDPWKHAVKLHKRLAYVPGDVSFWPNLTGGEIIDLLGDLRGGLDAKRREELLARFELDPTKKFRTYSKGNRQKVALVAALASDVELYILDEPTSGLDPLMESVFQDEIKKLKKQNKTILLSSHILAEVEALCDRVTIIREGKDVASNTLSELQKQHRHIVRVETADKLTLGSHKGISGLKHAGNVYEFEIDPAAINDIIRQLSHHKIHHLSVTPPTLESLFLDHYDEEKNA